MLFSVSFEKEGLWKDGWIVSEMIWNRSKRWRDIWKGEYETEKVLHQPQVNWDIVSKIKIKVNFSISMTAQEGAVECYSYFSQYKWFSCT